MYVYNLSAHTADAYMTCSTRVGCQSVLPVQTAFDCFLQTAHATVGVCYVLALKAIRKLQPCGAMLMLQTGVDSTE